MVFHWWYIPIWIVFIFVTGYLWGASKSLGYNDWKKLSKVARMFHTQ